MIIKFMIIKPLLVCLTILCWMLIGIVYLNAYGAELNPSPSEPIISKQLGFYNYTKDLETTSKNKGETPEGQPKLTNQEILNVIQSIVVQFKEKGYEILGIESDRNLIWVYGAIKQPKDNPLPPE